MQPLTEGEVSNMKLKDAKLLLLGVLLIGIPLLINSQFSAGVSFAQQQEREYSCPMHPEVKSKTGGSCPKCVMSLKLPPKRDENSSAIGWAKMFSSTRSRSIQNTIRRRCSKRMRRNITWDLAGYSSLERRQT